jgi:hypothetical protein
MCTAVSCAVTRATIHTAKRAAPCEEHCYKPGCAFAGNTHCYASCNVCCGGAASRAATFLFSLAMFVCDTCCNIHR